ncbi:MAG: RIP metalloprotease RseP [Candidatus Omnitrophica bacterium]|nr:RIP metalloprotease RseP [Candidatus Omnitrophota bacterium]
MIILSVIAVIVVFGSLIFVHELGHFLFARLFKVRVEKFAIGFGKKLWGTTKGDTEYRLNLVPLGGYCKIAGEDPVESKGNPDELWSLPPGKRFWVYTGGSLFNYVFAFLLLVMLFCFGVPKMTNVVGETLAGSPAQRVGIKAGDKIIAINNNPTPYWDDVLIQIRKDNTVQSMDVRIMRGKMKVDLKIVPEELEGTDMFKKKKKILGLGVAPSGETILVKTDPLKAVVFAGEHVWFFTKNTYKGLWYMITGQMPVKDNVGGPIRIIQILSDSVKYGIVSVISLMATISMALAIFNMLPFPVLDGGHVLFCFIEKIRRKPLSVKTMDVMANTAWILLLSFVIYVSYFDARRVVRNIKASNAETTNLVTRN